MKDEPVRVYTQSGKVAHLLGFGRSPNGGSQGALCGRMPMWPSEWYGTGTQLEHERAANLPLCIDCTKLRRQALRDR